MMLSFDKILNTKILIDNPWNCYYVDNFISLNEIKQTLTNLFNIKPETSLKLYDKNNMFLLDGKWTYKPKEKINLIFPELNIFFKNHMIDFFNLLSIDKKYLINYELNIEFANLSPGFKYEIHNDSKRKKISFIIYLTDETYSIREKQKLSTFLYNENFDQIAEISAEPGRLTFFDPTSRKCFHNMENNTRSRNRYTIVVNVLEV